MASWKKTILLVDKVTNSTGLFIHPVYDYVMVYPIYGYVMILGDMLMSF